MWLWALLPICQAVFGTLGIWTVFAVSVSNGSVNLTEGFPYISECGSYNPQSCLFSQMCNICSVLALWIVIIRFQQVKDFGNHGKANIAGIILGFISSVGISIIGNFQQSVVKSIHLLGAFLAFFLGLAYFWVLCTLLVVLMVVLHNTGSPSAAAVCEWVLVMLFFGLFGLFAAEFRHIDCHHLTIQKPSLGNASVVVNSFVVDAFHTENTQVQ
ncbi:hypothetical protein JOQ06_010617 [Pogonophryne albipinna]|uniref:CWH43-like N-terminal domain-containing protein n=1 Tax=Pogonophryne albipinna TaxID=1090488 RepID=A0AAD6AUB0_9TELE|nr:hypothetical protein JOQ06_010617 [Pogonophryne albipinna]